MKPTLNKSRKPRAVVITPLKAGLKLARHSRHFPTMAAAARALQISPSAIGSALKRKRPTQITDVRGVLFHLDLGKPPVKKIAISLTQSNIDDLVELMESAYSQYSHLCDQRGNVLPEHEEDHGHQVRRLRDLDAAVADGITSATRWGAI